MPISYKNKIYTTLGTPTELSGDVISVTDSAGVPAKDYTVKGKSIVWNQLLNKDNYRTSTINGVTLTANDDGTITANGTATSLVSYTLLEGYGIAGHKYCCYGCPAGGSFSTYRITNSVYNSNGAYVRGFSDAGNGGISPIVLSANQYNSSTITVASGTTVNNLVFKPQIFDLTNIFGAGKEPTTAAEFRVMFPDDYYPYNAGELKSIIPTSVEASTVNLLNLVGRKEISSAIVGHRRPTDAYPEIDTHVYYRGVSPNGYLVGGSVVEATVLSSSVIAKTGANAGYDGYGVGIPLTVVPSTTYYIKCTTSGVVSVGYANSNKIITSFNWAPSNNQFTTPRDCRYALIVFRPNAVDTLATFENICVSTVQTNEYQPYHKYRANIPSSKYFPDGMKSAGSVYDEINFLSQKAIKRIGVVDMGTLNWSYFTSRNAFQTNDLNTEIKLPATSSDAANLICTKYSAESYASGWAGTIDKCCGTTFATAVKWFWVRDTAYTDAAAFKAAMSGVMLYYELATPVETEITPPLQALSTFKGFTSFSAPNSLTQNGPLSVTYYAEGGTNPEKGWLTSYKRKLYMGRTIEWNQLLDKSKYPATTTKNGVTFTNNGDGTIAANGTADLSGSLYYYLQNVIEVPVGHKVLISGGVTGAGWSSYAFYDSSNPSYGYDNSPGGGKIYTVQTSPVKSYIFVAKGYTVSNITFKPQLFDLTQMFGAGNEPTTPAEFWSYFDHKLYPYNTGETQPLFKISRKSQWGAVPKHYTARWDKINAAMVRLNDAAAFPTNITNFAHRGSVNANYSNPFDNIYPWSGIKLCNISIDLYRNLAAGDSITQCVTAWEGDANFSYNDANGVWRYRPEFWGKSWEDDTYRYFDVTDQNVPGSNYVHYPEAIVGRWHGRNETLMVGGAEKTCLIPSVGMPAKRIAMSTLHTYAKNYGATIDSIFSIDADVLLCIVEFATMNTQNAIGNGVSALYRQLSDLIQENATNSTVVKVLAFAGSAHCIPGAIFDIGTSNGGAQVGSYYVVSVQPNIGDAQYLDVTLNEAVTVTTNNYWSVHGLANVADEEIGSKSGYIGTNGKCNSYYRGLVLFGNMCLYTLGAYENHDDQHIWIANSDEEADNYDALNTSVHYDTGLVLPGSVGYTKKLGMLSRSGLLSIPVFCTEIGGDTNNPTGDYFYNGVYTYNTVPLRGGGANAGSGDGAFYGSWGNPASYSAWHFAARPRLKNP